MRSLSKSREPLYTITRSGPDDKPSCLPTNINMDDLIDVTTVTDTWRKYVSKSNPGVVYDGAVYAKLAYQEELL